MNIQFRRNERRKTHSKLFGLPIVPASSLARSFVEQFLPKRLTLSSHFSFFLIALAFLLSGKRLRGDAFPPTESGTTPVAATNSTSGVWLSPCSDKVLVVYNADLPSSLEVAEYYARRRGIPRQHLLGIHPTSIAGYVDEYPYSLALAEIVAPLTNALTRIGPEKILYLVFTYGTPYSVYNDVWKYPRISSIKGASLDSYLSDPFGEAFAGTNIGAGQKTRFYANPYAPGTNATPHAVPGGIAGPVNALDDDRNPVVITNVVAYPPFESLAAFRSRTGKRVYAVFRLDGATPAIAKQQVDKAIQAEQLGGLDRLGGSFYFDRKDGDEFLHSPPPTGPWIYDRYVEWLLFRTKQMAIAAGFPWQQEDTAFRLGDTGAKVLTATNAAFYAGTYGWYNTQNLDGDPQPDPWTWLPGAIGIEWKSEGLYGGPRGDNNPPAGNDLDTGWGTGAIAAGITATTGGIAEPLDEGVPRPDAILRNLLEGANIGDAFFRDTWYLGWQILNVGDPLYTPFPGGRAPFNQNSVSPPRVFLTSPTTESAFIPPATLRLQATTQASAQPPLQVEFFLGANLLATLSSPPFDVTLSNLSFPTGAYELTAVLNDATGARFISPAVAVRFTTNDAPAQLELAVSDLAPFLSSPLVVTAAPRVTDNNTLPIEILLGTNVLGLANEPLFSITISNLPPDELTLAARTVDLQGRTIVAVPLTLPVLRAAIFGPDIANDSHFHLRLKHLGIGTTNIIQASTNLIDWISISTNVAPANLIEFSDPDTQNFERRYYRVLSPF